jgi:hypothetical protein
MLPMTGLAFLLAAPSVAGEVSLTPSVALDFGRGVVERALTGPLTEDEPFAAGERVVAFSVITPARSGFVQHVWYRDGEEVARHDLPVGAGRRWRTWSRHQVGPGLYTVQIIAADGEVLLEKTFEVSPWLNH